MVSVLPAHIALEMKAEMLMKTRKAQMRSIRENYLTKKENPSFVITNSSFFFLISFQLLVSNIVNHISIRLRKR